MPIKERFALSAEEIVRQGELLYERNLRQQVEAEHTGEFIALSLDNAEFEIDTDHFTAEDRLRERLPESILYVRRIGFPYSYHLGILVHPSRTLD